ncbi:MAG: hypothetical protein KZQ93_01115 [Candidatus Thiodiazotropha sp. (ex Monitilora ramsayi)]|nr:hypothetical protein [Candidatus Thiodiazotropha sp. (ex Monitilora ramsayi)]
MTLSLTLLGLLWIAYFCLHSLLASLWLKSRVAARHDWLMPAYRLIFNTLATLLLIPPVAYMFWLQGAPLWQFEGVWHWLRLAIMLVAVAGFLWSMRYYDGREFMGLKQLSEGQRDIKDQESLHISPMHRYVRHPWYSLGLLLIWTQDMDAARLVSALLITGYLIFGSRLEERKLKVYHGERYDHYCARVPGLIPVPWRHLTKEEADTLVADR